VSLIKQARDAAYVCTDYQKRERLKRATDDLHDAFGRFTASCSKEDMIDLVGAWTRVTWALDALPPLPGAGPNGGRAPLPRHEKLTDAA
jgi:hypothetical protein